MAIVAGATNAEAVVEDLNRQIEFNRRLTVLVDDMLHEPVRYVSDDSLRQRRSNLLHERGELIVKRNNVQLRLGGGRILLS
jgi:hypothetical protein